MVCWGGICGSRAPLRAKAAYAPGILEQRGICGTAEVVTSLQLPLMASIHLGSQSVVGASVHEFRKWVEGEREGGKATEVVHFQMSGQHLLV